jgi:metal-responsive CopG/Arc/MetJ family transcriptional regulator
MKNSSRIIVTLSQRLKKKLEEKAEKNGCSQAEVIRFALRRLVEVAR